jgi:hypothetical protein
LLLTPRFVNGTWELVLPALGAYAVLEVSRA